MVKTVIEVFMNSFYNNEEMKIAEQLTIANAQNKVSGLISKEMKRLEATKHKRDFIMEHEDKVVRSKLRQHNKEVNARVEELKQYKSSIGVTGEEKKVLLEQLESVIASSDKSKPRELRLTSNEIFVSQYNDRLKAVGLLTDKNEYKVKTIEDCTKENTWADSSLIRAIEQHRPFMNDDFVIINRGKELNNPIFTQLTEQGFKFKDEQYIFFSSSTNELKKSQATFIKKEIYDKIEMTLTCGLTLDIINAKGGMNTNKFMAYKSLSKASSKAWENFNIDEAIVIDDIEFDVKGKEVDYIHHQTLEEQLIYKQTLERLKKRKGLDKYSKQTKKVLMARFSKRDLIQRKRMDIPYNFTDGIGVTCDKSVSNRIVRFPWGKGLLTYDNYRNFIRNAGCTGDIKDIWGKKYSMTDLKNGKIKYIFFKSMFKMANYYSNTVDESGNVIKTGWEQYKENFKKYNCEMSMVHDEPKKLKKHMPLNYQMLQQLNAVATDDEVEELAKMSLDSIAKIGNDLDTTLRLFGAAETNENMTYFQKSLLRYKPLMKSEMMKKKIKGLKASNVKDFKSGKFEFDAVMTYVVPDTMIINQWLFKGIHDIYDMTNILSENDVVCDSFDDGRVDVLRSPSLGFEHNVMNIITPIKGYKKNYYNTRAIYTSAKSLLSKIVFFDNDGDRLYVVKNDTLCNMVDRFKKDYDIVPLYFEMEKAKDTELNARSFTDGMLAAFRVNIGEWSNPISKLWDTLDNTSSKEKVEETLKLINLFVMYNNFAIDSSKTNFIPRMTDYVAAQQKLYKSVHTKLPHFFKYAKNKTKRIINEGGEGFVDKLEAIYETKRNNFRWSMTEGFNKTQYDESVLTNDKDVEINLDDEDAMKKMYENILNNTTDKMKICPDCGSYFSYVTDDKQCKPCRGIEERLA